MRSIRNFSSAISLPVMSSWDQVHEEVGARLPHTMPNVGGGHNAALWNLRSLPPWIR
jgi:hypothetical protein